MEQRIAADYVEACHADVFKMAHTLPHRRWHADLEESLYRSVAAGLRVQMRRLRHHDSESSVLPESVREKVGRWKADVSRQQLESVVRLRASQWRSGVKELLLRLEKDWDDLVGQFGVAPEARVTGISEPLGDPHNEGRSVYRVAFEGQRSLIYKPRLVSGEYMFDRVLRWLRDQEVEPGLRSCRVLARDGYGWTEFIQPSMCETVDEAKAFYRRQGAFLVLFYLLHGSDCLDENCVVSGQNPVWVDLECVSVPRLPTPQEYRLPGWFGDSVLSTAFLCRGGEEKAVTRRDTGLSLSCMADREAVFSKTNILRAPYVAAVKSGFRDLYLRLWNSGAWISGDGPVAWWLDQPVRVIPRPTSLYTRLSEALFVVPSGERSELREAMAAAMARPGWPETAIEAELDILEQGDVPYWMGSTSHRAIREASGATVEGWTERPGIECVHDRCARMGEVDLNNQLWLIEAYLLMPSLN